MQGGLVQTSYQCLLRDWFHEGIKRESSLAAWIPVAKFDRGASSGRVTKYSDQPHVEVTLPIQRPSTLIDP